jgi:hypothetical protein
LIVIGEDLLGAAYISRCALEFNGIGFQIDGDVQTVFQHMQILIARAEQGLNIRTYLDTLFHSVVALFLPRVRCLDKP